MILLKRYVAMYVPFFSWCVLCTVVFSQVDIDVLWLFSNSLESLLSRYLKCHMFTEMCLDGIFKYGDDNTLPSEVTTWRICWSPHHCCIDRSRAFAHAVIVPFGSDSSSYQQACLHFSSNKIATKCKNLNLGVYQFLWILIEYTCKCLVLSF